MVSMCHFCGGGVNVSLLYNWCQCVTFVQLLSLCHFCGYDVNVSLLSMCHLSGGVNVSLLWLWCQCVTFVVMYQFSR